MNVKKHDLVQVELTIFHPERLEERQYCYMTVPEAHSLQALIVALGDDEFLPRLENFRREVSRRDELSHELLSIGNFVELSEDRYEAEKAIRAFRALAGYPLTHSSSTIVAVCANCKRDVRERCAQDGNCIGFKVKLESGRSSVLIKSSSLIATVDAEEDLSVNNIGFMQHELLQYICSKLRK